MNLDISGNETKSFGSKQSELVEIWQMVVRYGLIHTKCDTEKEKETNE